MRKPRDPAPLGKRAGAPYSRLCWISPAPADHGQRDLIVLLTPHPASSHEVAQSPRQHGTSELPRWASVSCPSQTPHAARDPHALRGSPACPPADLPRPSRMAPKPGVPGPPLPPILRRAHPRTSWRGRLSPRTSCAAAGSESHPQVIPRALAAATAAAAAIRTGPSMHRAGQQEGAAPRTPGRGRRGGLARGPRSPRTEPREPGTRDSGEDRKSVV